MEPLEQIAQLTPNWLTKRLRANGHLKPTEDVVHVQTESSAVRSATGATVSLFTAQYSPSVKNMPEKFFLKTGDKDGGLPREVQIHCSLFPQMDSPPTVPCFDGLANLGGEGRGHILFQDVSHSHYHGDGALGPTLKDDCECIVDALAQVHAFWWDHPLLGQSVDGLKIALPDVNSILFGQDSVGYARTLAKVIDKVGDRLTSSMQRTYERALSSFPLKDLEGHSRLMQGNGLTLIHGDLQYENIFLPRNPTGDSVYLIDWGYCGVRVGTDDLASLGLHGFSSPEANLTRGLVRRYHDRLLENGVQNYTWEDCWHDYGLSTIRTLFIPLTCVAHASSSEKINWCWQNLERVFAAFDDLGFAELLAVSV